MKDKFDVSDFLEKVFNNVNYWLNFAELKNSINVAFGIAFIAAIFSTGTSGVVLRVSAIVVCISMVISFFSFFPYVGTKMFHKMKKKKNPNLIFWGDCQCYTGEEYLELVNIRFLNNSNYNNSEYQKDLANEIVYNSRVASVKYNCFAYSAVLDVIAIIIAGIALCA